MKKDELGRVGTWGRTKQYLILVLAIAGKMATLVGVSTITSLIRYAFRTLCDDNLDLI